MIPAVEAESTYGGSGIPARVDDGAGGHHRGGGHQSGGGRCRAAATQTPRRVDWHSVGDRHEAPPAAL
jgi:hypothetical protein